MRINSSISMLNLFYINNNKKSHQFIILNFNKL
jgi:hypothetical protein